MLLHDTPTIAWTTELEMAQALYDAGDYRDVLRVVDPISARDGLDPVTRFVACQLKSCAHSQLGEWAESLDALRLSESIVDELPAEKRGKFFGQRALAHRNLGHIDAAFVDYEQARDCALEVGDEATVANVRNNIAKIYGDTERGDEAIVEVDAAIRIATRLHDDVSLGRFLDMKAQILVGQKKYTEALRCSTKAISLLSKHSAISEARWTHGLAMIGAGTDCLDKPKTVEQFRARHDAAKTLDVELDAALLETALRRANGHVLAAAELLHVSHSAVIKLARKHRLERVAKRRRNKSLIQK